jgi:hypothetical protein
MDNATRVNCFDRHPGFNAVELKRHLPHLYESVNYTVFNKRQGIKIEYNSAYDIMGGYDSAWTRPGIPGFPTGAFTAPNPDPVSLVGLLISAAQLSMSRYRTQLPGLFAEENHSEMVTSGKCTVHCLEVGLRSQFFQLYAPGLHHSY